MIRIDDLLDRLETLNPTDNLDLLRRAYMFSAWKHQGQVRMSGEPYLMHPLEVAGILVDLHLDSVTIAAGLLHDVVEDTRTTIETLREYFGDTVAHLVEGVTKLSKIPFSSQEEKQAENFRKMLLAMVDDIRVIVIKLADRLHNMRTLEFLPEEKRRRIAQETLDIYAPIANRLGIGKIRNELEDLAFRHLDPAAYIELENLVGQRRRASEEFIREMEEKVRTALKESSIPAAIQSRIKRNYSIYLKMKRQKITIEQVYDFIALRILTDTERNCYAVMGYMHQIGRPVPGRIKDFIAIPKPNLYQSIHTSIVDEKGRACEIQIRTHEMHRVAEEGIAAHWKYKEGKPAAESEDQHVQWLRQLLEYHREVKDPKEFLSILKVDLYPDEVYAFTPKGQVISLPRGSTSIDFAYAIHTQIGNRCSGARVNGQLVPLRHRLRSGDFVEIITAQSNNVSRDWLNIVKTSRARHKIKHIIQQQDRARSVEVGAKLWEKECRKYKINPKKVDEDLVKKLPEYGMQKIEDFYASLGYGKMSAKTVLTRLMPEATAEEPAPAKESRIASAVKKAFGLGEKAIKVKGAEDVLVYLAKCCNPIKGERIVGYITRGKGVAVHAERCSNVTNLLYDAERKIDVNWDGTSEAPYGVPVEVEVDDRPGMLAKVTTAVAAAKTNIRAAKVETDEGRGYIKMEVEVADVKHLDKILSTLRGIQGVSSVERVYEEKRKPGH
ncbi:MAG: bifunctional (p)ppGpp synthetase/guanosine-3',5'-bis(diphosphate) 3'-pyrophosphohydrolase [Acidobacteriota bacterium]